MKLDEILERYKKYVRGNIEDTAHWLKEEEAKAKIKQLMISKIHPKVDGDTAYDIGINDCRDKSIENINGG